MKTPLIIISKSFQTVLITTPFTESVFIEFCYDPMGENYPVTYQEELSLTKHNDFQPLESRRLNKA